MGCFVTRRAYIFLREYKKRPRDEILKAKKKNQQRLFEIRYGVCWGKKKKPTRGFSILYQFKGKIFNLWFKEQWLESNKRAKRKKLAGFYFAGKCIFKIINLA